MQWPDFDSVLGRRHVTEDMAPPNLSDASPVGSSELYGLPRCRTRFTFGAPYVG
jgi:hypothetical protein